MYKCIKVHDYDFTKQYSYNIQCSVNGDRVSWFNG